MDHIVLFRKTYLANQEWLIAIGGNLGTQEEYEAARDCGVKVVSIPCFGGTAASTATSAVDGMLAPCKTCTKRDGMCSQQTIEEIVASLDAARS